MGTNFYLGRDAAHNEGAHIGKRSGAGGGLCSFALQGYRETDAGPLTSWRQWRAAILAVGTVTDEYGRERPAHDFIAEVESTTLENRGRQHAWILAHLDDPMVASHAKECWLDDEGFSFTFTEFS